MNTSAHIGVMQTHQAQSDVRTSRIRALRILGGLQISLGILCGILGIVGAILSSTEMKSGCKLYNIYDSYNRYVYKSSYHRCGQSDTILIMDLISMAFSGWFMLTGCFPFCMTEKRESSWRCLKLAYLVGNIISEAVFSSTVVGLGILGALIVDLNPNTRSVVAMSSLLTIFSFSEFVISIVAAAHCCCCSQLSAGNHQGVIYMNTSQSGMMCNMPNTQIPSGNQQGYNQTYMPQMQGINGQQPANMPNYPQQAGYSQGNEIPIQGNYGQQSEAFGMANQQQNINAQHTMAPAVYKN